MFVHIDYNSSEPISHQVVAQIKWMVVSGKLGVREKLPSVRGLAKQLQINPTTVTRIYNELSNDGIITLRQGQGAFVADGKQTMPRAEAKKKVAEMSRALLVESLRWGLEKDDIDAILAAEYEKIRTAVS